MAKTHHSKTEPSHIAVTVRWHGSVVADSIFSLETPVVLGEDPRAAVSFPGARLVVQKHESAVWLGPRRLAEQTRIRKGDLEVSLVVQRSPVAPPEPAINDVFRWVAQRSDPRLLLATSSLVLFLTWCQAVTMFQDSHQPELARVMALTPLVVVETAPEIAAPSERGVVRYLEVSEDTQ